MAVSQAAMRRRARIMRAANVPMRAALSLPFATPLSGNLMLISHVGRKTGRQYRQPVSYVRDGDTLLTPGGGRWTRNLETGRPVSLRLSGKDHPAIPTIIDDLEEVQRHLTVIVTANPAAKKFMPIALDEQGRPDRDTLMIAIEHGF